jgi:hypothetical protein
MELFDNILLHVSGTLASLVVLTPHTKEVNSTLILCYMLHLLQCHFARIVWIVVVVWAVGKGFPTGVPQNFIIEVYS